jgi:hypothetical protein
LKPGFPLELVRRQREPSVGKPTFNSLLGAEAPYLY